MQGTPQTKEAHLPAQSLVPGCLMLNLRALFAAPCSSLLARGQAAEAGSVISGFIIPEARIHRAHVNEPAGKNLIGSAHPETCILCGAVE